MANKINILLTEANGNLANHKAEIISAAKAAENYAFVCLGIDWDIDVLITNRISNMTIPEDGVGGRTQTSDFIEFAIDEGKMTSAKITEMLIHELCHAARWGRNDEWMRTLFDGVINEGIAAYFEAEYANSQPTKTFFIKTIMERSDAENKRILALLQDQLDAEHYDYEQLFYTGNDELPRWAGYSLGYYLVKTFIAKTNKDFLEIFTAKYSDFKIALPY